MRWGTGFTFFQWWGGLSPWLRYGVAILFILASTATLFTDRVWYWGWIVGTILLMFAEPSDSEKKGYRF